MHARILIVISVLLATTTALVTQAASSTTRTPPPTSKIPPGYTYYPATGSYYKFHHNSSVTWDVAKTTCASEGAHLVMLNNAEEADIVARIMKNGAGEFSDTWIGLRDGRPGGVIDWRTVHGEPLSDVFNVWYEGRPDNDGRFLCGSYLRHDNAVFDLPCDFTRFLTCEISQ